MERITKKDLELSVQYLNELTGNPTEPYTKIDGRLVANVGNYHISGAYGGNALHRMHNTSGGISTPLHTGYIPKRELYRVLRAFISGIETAQNK